MITRFEAIGFVGREVAFDYKGSKDAKARRRRVLVVSTLFDHGKSDGIRAKDLDDDQKKFPKKFVLENIKWL